MNTNRRSMSFGPGLRRALSALAVVAGAAFAPTAVAAPIDDYNNNCGSAGGCHVSPPEGPRFNAANASNVILQANANHGMGVGGLSSALLSSIAGYIATVGPPATATATVGYRTLANTISVTSLYVDNSGFDNAPAINGTANGTLGAGSGTVGHPAVPVPAGGVIASPSITYSHTGTTCAADAFDVVGTTASNGNTTNRRINVNITPPTVSASNVTVGAIAYNTAATAINISGSIAVSGVGSAPTGTLQLSGQTGVGTTAATGPTTLTYAATGTTYSSTVTVNYVAQGPCSTNSGATRTITIPVTAPPAPTGTNLGPVTVPAGSGTATALPVTGQSGYLSANPLTVVSQPPAGQGTVTVTGPAQFTYTASGYTGATSFTYTLTGPSGAVSATYTYSLSPTAAPVVTATSATTAYNTAIAINLAAFITGSVTSVTPSGAVNGAALATGPTTITFTPTAGFFGTGSFQYTATGPGGTSPTAATVTVTVNPPPPTVSAAAVSIPYNGGSPVVSTTIDLAPYIGPPGATVLSVSPSGATNGTVVATGPTTVSFTPTAGYVGAASFNYAATNAGGASAGSATVSITVTPPPPPVANSLSVLVSATAPTTINLASSISGIYTTVSIVSAPVAGSVSLAGTLATYTPLLGFSGSTTFTYRATGPGGNSGTATVTVTYTAAPVTSDRTLTVPYDTAATIDLTSAFSGVITSYSITRQPAHGSAVMNGPLVTYTPFPGYYGPDSFQFTAVGPGGSSSPGTVGITVNPPVATVVGLDATVPFNSPGIIDLTRAVSGSATSFTLATPPAHGTVVISGTTATYTPAPGYSGPDSFSVVAVNATGSSQPGTINVTVGTLRPSATAATLTVAVNESGTIDLAPYISGSGVSGVLITGLPAHGLADVNGTKVTYTPSTGFFGSDTFAYVAFGNAGKSSPATVKVTIVGRPDPTQDPAVTGLLDAQAQTARRFSRAQITNFQRRMESLHVPGPVSRNPENSAQAVPAPVPATTPAVTAAGLRDKLAGQAGAAPVARPGSALESTFAGMLAGFASSRSLDLSGSTDGRTPVPLDGVSFWVGGTASFGTRSLGDEFGSFRFSTDGISVGADRRLGDRLALGVGLGFARDRSDILGDGTNNRARGRSFAAYGTYHPSPRTYLDTVLGFGTLTFDSERWVTGFDDFARASRKGDQFFGSVAYGYEYRRGATLVSPYGRLDVTEDRLKRATESGAGVAALTYEEQRLRTTSATAGLRIESTHETDYGRVTPRARVEFRHDFEGSRSASLSYADQYQGLAYSVTPAGSTRNALLIGVGSDFLLGRGWKVGVDYQGERSSGPGTVQSVRFLVSKDLDDKGFPAWSGWSMPLAIPVDVDGGMLWDSNIGRGRLPDEVRSDRIYTLDATRTYEFPLSAHTRLLATANLEVDKPHTYTGFGRFAAGGKAEYQYRASGDFDATTWGAYARGTYDKFESNLRTGPSYAVGVNARRSLTDRIDLFADVSLLRRYGRSSVFETRETAARFNLDYSFGRKGTAYLSGEYRKGDAVSTGFPSLANLALADVAVQDDAFDGGEFFSYRFDARTVLGTLGFNMPLGARDSIDLSVRRVQTTPTLRPAFDDGTRMRYIVNQYSLLYLLRF